MFCLAVLFIIRQSFVALISEEGAMGNKLMSPLPINNIEETSGIYGVERQ